PNSDLHSFPTRRSSDLAGTGEEGGMTMRSLVPVNRLRALDALSDLTRQMERLFDEMNASWSELLGSAGETWIPPMDIVETDNEIDRKSTRLNSSHVKIS